MRVGAILCFAACAACGGDEGALLLVDVRTSLPASDFDRVRTEVRPPGSDRVVADVEIPVDPDVDYATGARVAEISVAPSSYVLTVSLLCEGVAVGSAVDVISVDETVGVLLEVAATRGCARDGDVPDVGVPDASTPDAFGSDAGMNNCTSASDRAILANEAHGMAMNETFDEVIHRRSVDCVNAGQSSAPALYRCVLDALVSETDVSSPCGDCYARAAVCTYQSCWWACSLGATAASCIDCRCSTGCEAAVEACSGVPRFMCL